MYDVAVDAVARIHVLPGEHGLPFFGSDVVLHGDEDGAVAGLSCVPVVICLE